MISSIKQGYELLNSKQKKSSLSQVFFMFIAMMFEFLGLGLLVPILNVLAGQQNPYLIRITAWITNHPSPIQNEQVFAAIFLFIIINLMKMLFLIFQARSQAKFIFNIKTNLAQNLLHKYMHESYIYHVQHNSSSLVRNITTVVGQFCDALTAIFTIITDSFLLLGSLILLLFIYPIITLYCIALVGVVLYLFQRLTRKRVKKWGEEFHQNENTRLKHAQQILSGIKEIKIFGKENFFFKKFVQYDLLSSRAGQFQRIANAMPRAFLEMFSVLLISSVLILMFVKGEASGTILSAVGILVASAFRLLPSVYRISSALQNVTYLTPAIAVLSNDTKTVKETIGNTGGAVFAGIKEGILLQNLSFSYPETIENTLSVINIEIPVNSTVALIGTTGAGKSTLVELILGLIMPSAGNILVDGKSIHNNIRAWQNVVGYVPQNIYLIDDTIRRNIAFGIDDEKIDDEAVNAAIKAAQLEVLINDIPSGIHTVVGERGVKLSGGQKQRIGIARALYNNPELLIFDEATSALDSKTEKEVMRSLDLLKGQKTIIVIAHRLTSVSNADYVYRLEKGHIIDQGKPEKVFEGIIH
jgi:ABC-type multidrug transport system fused ATPase/permease subunit